MLASETAREAKHSVIAPDYRAVLGEGPHWDPTTHTLYWIDIIGKKVFVHSAGKTTAVDLPKMPGCLAPTDGNKLVVALQDGIALLNLSDQQVHPWKDRSSMESDLPLNRFNDGKVDPQGRFWVGSVAINCQGTAGTLFSIGPEGTVKVRREKVGISNGLAWSPDGKTMYFIDSPTKKVVAFDFDGETGDISNERTIVTLNPEKEEVPDGMTIDTEGMLWVAIWGGSRVSRFDPSNGKLLDEIEIPALNVTSCCFGGADLDVLYVTSASCDTDLNQYPQAGFTFEFKDLGFKGFPMGSF